MGGAGAKLRLAAVGRSVSAPGPVTPSGEDESSFKARFSREYRVRLSLEARQLHPDKVPIIIEAHGFDLPQCRLLVAATMSLISILALVREEAAKVPGQTPCGDIELTVCLEDGTPHAVPINTRLDVLYERFIAADGLLYLYAVCYDAWKSI